jgi:Holliday junction resolvase
MKEADIQSKKMKQLEEEGYYVIKLIRTNKNGIPDIIAIPPGVPVKFIEVKKPGENPRPLQEYRMKELRSYGFITEVYDGDN